MEKPIFILGSHKSGTSLLRNLFDGMPELFVIPNEAHFFEYTGYGVDYALRHATPGSPTFEDVIRRIRRAIEHSNTKPVELKKHGDSYLTGLWHVETLERYLREHGAVPFEHKDMRAFFDCYVEALHAGLYNQPPTAPRFVEKSVENAEFAPVLKQLYPDARFIHIVRNPYTTLVSLRKFKTTRGRYPSLGLIIDALRNSYYYLYQNPLHVADYMIIRYEDLLTDTHEQMQRIARFVGLVFDDRLLKPTTMSAPWAGNSMSGQDFQGISTRPITAWEQEIVPLEIALVNLLFQHVLRDYHYPQRPMPPHVYLPVKGENPRTYIANRVLLRQVRTLSRVESNVI